MIGIRTDGNSKIGTGHIMRSLSIANAIRGLGQEVMFITVDDYPQLSHFPCQKIKGEYDNLALEIPKIAEVLKKHNVQALLLDTYFANDDYYAFVNDYTTTVAMFDFGAVPKYAHKIINYNIYWDTFAYPKTAKCLLGCNNAPLREEFTKKEYTRDYTKADTLMITTGGTDPYNITGKLLNYIAKDAELSLLNVNVIIGGLNPFEKELKQYENHKIKCLKNPNNMREIMEKSHIAVCAGGTTLYELCSMSLPSVIFSFVDNQDLPVYEFCKKGIMLNGGNYFNDNIFQLITKNLKLLVKDKNLRMELGEKSKKTVGNKGAKNIARFVCGLEEEV